MRILFRVLVVSLSLFLFHPASEISAQTKNVKKAEKQAEKKKEQQKKDYEKAKKKDVKHRFEIQTPETKKRMKETRKKSNQVNSRGKDPFLKRLFHHKKHP